MRAVNIRAGGDAIVVVRGVDQTFGRVDEFVEASCLFFVRRSLHDGDAVGDDGRAALRNDVGEFEILLLLIEPHVRHVPQADESFAARQFLHEQCAVSSVFVNIRIKAS